MPSLTRRALASLVVAGAAGAQLAQGFPARTVEWVVPYPAGGGSDVAARTLAEPMAKALGQSIVVSNRPGAGTSIAADYTARARADGHVVMTADTATLASNPALYRRLPYDPERDLLPVGLIGRFTMLLVVGAAVPAGNLQEFLAWARAQAQPVAFATPGAGSPHHLAMALLQVRTGLAVTHVPYRGAAPAVQDVASGQVPVMFVDSAAGHAQIAAGRLRPLAVAAPRRMPALPQVPTFAEQGLDSFEAYAWQGLVVPYGTPTPIIRQLSQALAEALDSTAVKARFQVLGIEPTPGTPAQMAAYAAAERARWAEIIRQAGITLD